MYFVTTKSNAYRHISVPPNVSMCSSPITVNESTDVACMCKAERGNTPKLPSVTWYKDGKQIGNVGKGMRDLKLTNVNRNDAGLYTCKANSYGLMQEKSIQVNVNCKYYFQTDCLQGIKNIACLKSSHLK